MVALASGGILVAASLSLAYPSKATATAPSAGDQWVASWAASPTDALTPIDAAGLPVPEVLDDQTVRMIVTPHLGGRTLRVHLSNRFGLSPVTIGQVTVGREGSQSASGIAAVIFGGKTAITIPVGEDVVSDPVRLTFSAFQRLAVDIFVPGLQFAPTKHWNANATSFYSVPLGGNLTNDAVNTAFPLVTEAWLYVDGIDVEAPTSTGTIVAFGDSITDGYVAATPVSQPVSLAVADKNGRYPDDLQRRINAAGLPYSVVNAGIGSNRLVTDGEPLFLGLSGLQRFEDDALDVPGVKGILLTEGINDLGLPPATTTASQLIAGYVQCISMAHAAHVKLWLGTLSPASNAVFDGVLTAPLSEVNREQVNSWIRTQHLADGIVDFDLALRDPSNPTVLKPAYAGPDNLHPNLLGYQGMANAVNLNMLSG